MTPDDVELPENTAGTSGVKVANPELVLVPVKTAATLEAPAVKTMAPETSAPRG